jgi:hypothetical protein
MQQLSNPPQDHPLSNQGPCLVRDPIIPVLLAQLGFDTLRNKTTEHPRELSFLPLGKHWGKARCRLHWYDLRQRTLPPGRWQ